MKPSAAAFKPSRVLVVSSSEYLLNPFVYSMSAQQGPADNELATIAMPYVQYHLTKTIVSFENMLNWSTNEVDLAEAGARITQPAAMHPPAPVP